MKALPKRKGKGADALLPADFPERLNESPPEKEGKSPERQPRAPETVPRLNESPPEKEGKLGRPRTNEIPPLLASMKALPKRKGNDQPKVLFQVFRQRLNESPPEKEGKCGSGLVGVAASGPQ